MEICDGHQEVCESQNLEEQEDLSNGWTCVECGRNFRTSSWSLCCDTCKKRIGDDRQERELLSNDIIENENNLTCKYCGKYFSVFCDLRRHMDSGDCKYLKPETPYECSTHIKSFNQKVSFTKHIENEIYTKTIPYETNSTVDSGETTPRREEDVNERVPSDTKSSSWNDTYQVEVQNPDLYTTHSKDQSQHHQQCAECGNTFESSSWTLCCVSCTKRIASESGKNAESQSRLSYDTKSPPRSEAYEVEDKNSRLHTTQSKDPSQHSQECVECGKNFQSTSWTLCCDTCSKRIASESGTNSENQSIRQHMDHRNPTCKYCGMKFKDDKNITKHIKSGACKNLPKPEPSWECPKCKRGFTRKDYFTKHVKLKRCRKSYSNYSGNNEKGPLYLTKSPSRSDAYEVEDQNSHLHTTQSKAPSQHNKKCVECGINFKSTSWNRCCDTCSTLIASENNSETQSVRQDMDQRHFMCKYCGKKFKDDKNVITHINSGACKKLPKPEPSWECPKCKRGFTRRDYCTKHVKLKRCSKRPKLWKCPKCKTGFTRKDNCIKHLRLKLCRNSYLDPSHINEKRVPSDTKSPSWNNTYQVEVQNPDLYTTHSKDQSQHHQQCAECGKTFESSILDYLITTELELECSNCMATFSSSNWRLCCDKCLDEMQSTSKEGGNYAKLEEAKQVHIPDDSGEATEQVVAKHRVDIPEAKLCPREEDDCNRPRSVDHNRNEEFNQQNNTELSSVTVAEKPHNEISVPSKSQTDIYENELYPRKRKKKKPHLCVECGKILSGSSHLRTHILQVHSNDTPYKCKICGKSFKFKRYLEKFHMLTHTAERPYVCEVCGKSFATDAGFNAHAKYHREKKFKCDICSKMTHTKGQLQSHMTVHTGERAFVCKVCKKAFKVENALMRHMLIHTGDQPYQCKYCGRQFNQNCSLKRHERLHTGERPYHCPHCEKVFIQSVSLTKHLATHKSKRKL